MKISLAPYHAELDRITPMCWTGQVTEVVGLLVESRGPSVAIGDFCEVRTATGRRIRTQVIGFRNAAGGNRRTAIGRPARRAQ
jgi:flagellum-specific ATP synthase